MALTTNQITALVAQVSETNITDIITGLSAINNRSAVFHNTGIPETPPNSTASKYAAAVSNWCLAKFVELGFADALVNTVELGAVTFPGSYPYGGYCDTYNVMASITGCLYPNKHIIIGAHQNDYIVDPLDVFEDWLVNTDWRSPSADDNASGCAAVLEIARIIMASGYIPEYTLDFVLFGSEDEGKRGATAYAEAAALAGTDIVVAIMFDMIGYTTNPPNGLTMKINHWDASVSAGWDGHADDAAIYAAAKVIAEQYGSLIVANNYINTSTGDQWPFHLNEYNILYFEEEDRSPYYHTEEDTLANMSVPYAANITKGALAVVAVMAGLSDELVRGQILSDRYGEGYTIGSGSDATKPITGDDLVLVQMAGEPIGRVALAKDLLGVTVATLAIQAPDAGHLTLGITAGVIDDVDT